MSSCWIFKVADDKNDKYSKQGIQIYSHRMRELFWGIKGVTKNGRKASNVDYLRKGDDVLFYHVGKSGQCFLGTAELASGFKTLEPDESTRITHEEYLDWQQGVSLNKDSIDVWAEPLPIERLQGKVHFVPKGENYGSYLQGSITRIEQQEYDIAIRENRLTD